MYTDGGLIYIFMEISCPNQKITTSKQKNEQNLMLTIAYNGVIFKYDYFFVKKQCLKINFRMFEVLIQQLRSHL